MEIGAILREAREANNLSLDDIQEITKIQKRYLVAIEQNDFHALPGRFYARAFIKEYAQAVELNAADLLRDFDEENIKTEEEETVQYTRLERSKRPRAAKSSSIFSLLPSVIVVILIIGIFFVAWTLYQKTLPNGDVDGEEPQGSDEIIRNVEGNDPDSETDTNNEGEESPDETEPDEQQNEAASFSVVEVGTGNSPLSTLDFHYQGEQVEVVFEASGTTYVELQGDSGEVLYAGNIDPSMEIESFDVSTKERIYFNIGNTPALIVKINGVELTYPVDDRVHQKLWVNLNKNE